MFSRHSERLRALLSTPAEGEGTVILSEDECLDALDDLRRLVEQLEALVEAARPFGELAQEMLNGHSTGRIPPGAPQRLLAALAVAESNPASGSPALIAEPKTSGPSGEPEAGTPNQEDKP